MKRVFFLIIIALLCNLAFTQVPESFNYQAVVRDVTNNPITDQAVSFRISILKGGVSGSEEYVETHSTSTNGLGLVNLAIGEGDVESGDFTAIDWGADNYFLKVEIDPAGGTSYIEMGTTQLLSVPYAMYAKTSSDAVKLTGNQTIAGNKTFSGTTTVPEPVNETDAATKAYVDVLLEKVEYLESLVGVEESVTDSDGNTYPAIRIGTQVWIIENLKTTKYNDGTSIPLVTNATDWENLTTPGYCWYDNDEVTYGDTYGALYNWYTVNTGNLCPTSWHVPSDAEWNILSNYLGGESVAGGKLKETGTIHWASPNTGATNETGFTALPGGYRDHFGYFDYIGQSGYWWSATETDTYNAWLRGMLYGSSSVSRLNTHKEFGISVRCIKDE